MFGRRTQTEQEREDAKSLRMRERLEAVTGARHHAATWVTPVFIDQSAAPVETPKTPDRFDSKIRSSARGEDCLVRIPGCQGNPEMTIWSHAPLGAGGKGKSLKALDTCGAYCCTYCDGVVDGQIALPDGYTRSMALLDWMYGHLRSLVRLRQKGLA